ncbi:MAG: hypothetical protein ACKV0T_05210, partial [Planctomycetales bacterium]
HDELQMGVVSGLSDVDHPEVAPLLVSGLGYYSDGNRRLAIDALLRTDQRTAALLDALQSKQLQPSALSDAQRRALREHKQPRLRERALRLLTE